MDTITETPIRRQDALSDIRASDHEEYDAELAHLDITKLRIQLTDTPKPLPDFNFLGFGKVFSDHIAITTFHPETGWSAPEIKPYGPLTLEPSSSCFQYGTNIYEGMKAYLGRDGKIRLFRPEMNMRRLERSVARLALPAVDGDAVLELIKRLVMIEKRWIPTGPGNSLYLRPTMIGTRTALGLAASDHAHLYVITTPAGLYFSRPLSLLAVSNPVRAWPGGTGAHKVGGNYSPTFLPQRIAFKAGYDHVLWLLPKEGKEWVTEGGAMNIFVVVEREDSDDWDVITPALDGTILPGITRASCLTLLSDPAFVATVDSLPIPKVRTETETGTGINTGTETETDSRDWTHHLHPAERAFAMSDLERWSAAQRLREVFCVGTAALVCAIHRIGFRGHDLNVYPKDAEGDPYELGPVGRALKAWLMGIQDGTIEYRGWGVVCE